MWYLINAATESHWSDTAIITESTEWASKLDRIELEIEEEENGLDEQSKIQ